MVKLTFIWLLLLDLATHLITGEIINDEKEIANVFNDFFVNKIKLLKVTFTKITLIRIINIMMKVQ